MSPKSISGATGMFTEEGRWYETSVSYQCPRSPLTKGRVALWPLGRGNQKLKSGWEGDFFPEVQMARPRDPLSTLFNPTEKQSGTREAGSHRQNSGDLVAGEIALLLCQRPASVKFRSQRGGVESPKGRVYIWGFNSFPPQPDFPSIHHINHISHWASIKARRVQQLPPQSDSPSTHRIICILKSLDKYQSLDLFFTCPLNVQGEKTKYKANHLIWNNIFLQPVSSLAAHEVTIG